MCISILTAFVGCGNKKADAFVIMTEELDGLFNPFYSTTAADGTIVAMTQISMLTTDLDKNNNVTVSYGDDVAVVTKDYQSVTEGDHTTYTFVIKNGIKFSDGEALTIEDVLFNLYVYLDPVYTGSSTMYSTDIVGLKDYRTQSQSAGDDTDDIISETANNRAEDRINELKNIFYSIGDPEGDGSYFANEAAMKAAILTWDLSSGYTTAIAIDGEGVTNETLLQDYERTLQYFKEELGDDYVSAQEAYDLTKEPYKSWSQYFNNEIFRFMCYEGFVSIEYEKDAQNKDIKTKIKKITPQYNESVVKNKEAAINYVYNANVSSNLDVILSYWATANKLKTEYAAKAKEVVLRENMSGDTLAVPNISGIVSLGHTGPEDMETITVNDKEYKIAKEHNEDGTPANENEYDVLQITINGVDPKAVWNFAFSVAPQHYYAKGRTVDIKNDEFGVEFGSFDFMTNEIQSVQNIKIPVGAGAYKATNKNNSDNPGVTEFFSDNVVYFKANNNFMFKVNIPKVRYQVVSASNALNALASGAVHYATPQLTNDNIDKLNSLKKDGITYTYTDQLGYGYIGINAGKVKDINLRKAIMSAMDTSLAINYYRTGTASTIYWPMSTVSWAYPKDSSGNLDRDNEKDYVALNFSDEAAKESILTYMDLAGVSAGDSELTLKFTIAGSNLTDHPTYATFQKAADLLNECGWDVEVVADTQALTKLSTGSLAVWAAAWGSTIDPDLYQVYHKNSTATSVLAWGYREILASPDLYSEETAILDELSEKIDAAREIEDQEQRAALYKEAMSLILDMAIEMPVYQRSVLYAYNGDVIDVNSLPETINPYSSPLDKIWEIKLVTD